MRIGRIASRADFLGILSFSYIIIYSLLILWKGFNFMTSILLLIGIGGLCIDSFVVSRVLKKWLSN